MILSAVAIVAHIAENGEVGVLGTCFAYRHPTRFLTAHHVIREREPSTLRIFFSGGLSLVLPVTAIHPHANADIAILEINDTGSLSGIVPYSGILTGIHFGEDYGAFGFPEDLFNEHAGGSPHRLISGYYQRFFDFERAGYRYRAGELASAAPAGMSGGPVFRFVQPTMLTGVVTGNIETSTWPEMLEEKTREGEIERTTQRRIVQYGIAVMLEPLVPWINEHIPQ